MGLKIGTNEPSSIYVGSSPVSAVYVGENQVWPDDRKPTANTIAYYPLTKESALLDKSSYNRQIVNQAGTITFVDKDGVNCAYFGSNGSYFSINTSDISTAYTVSFWLNIVNKSNQWTIICFLSNGTASETASRYGINPYISSSGYYGHGTCTTNPTYTDYISSIARKTGWHNFTLTFNGTSYIQYLDGEQIKSGTQNISVAVNSLWVGIRNNILSSQEYWNGYMSRIIVEKAVWSSDEVASYFRKTKRKYGITS